MAQYYHRTRRDGNVTQRRHEAPLPSIQHLVGDEYGTTSSTYNMRDFRHALPNVPTDNYPHHTSYVQHDHRGPTLPPIRSSDHRSQRYPHQSHSTPTHRDDPYSHRSYRDERHGRDTLERNMEYPESSPNGAYLILYQSKKNGLVNFKNPSSSPHGIIRSSELPDDGDYDPKKKYVCPDCRKRFDRPSGLETHERTHNGKRPFPCLHPGCDSTFTANSNRTRHMRSQHPERHATDHYHGHLASHSTSSQSSPPSARHYSRHN